MTRSDLIDQLCRLYPQVEAKLIEDAVSLFFFEIASSLNKGQRVELRGLGTFSIRERGKRVGRNPKTGEKVMIEPKLTPFFKAGKELREAINQKHFRPQLFCID